MLYATTALLLFVAHAALTGSAYETEYVIMDIGDNRLVSKDDARARCASLPKGLLPTATSAAVQDEMLKVIDQYKADKGITGDVYVALNGGRHGDNCALLLPFNCIWCWEDAKGECLLHPSAVIGTGHLPLYSARTGAYNSWGSLQPTYRKKDACILLNARTSKWTEASVASANALLCLAEKKAPVTSGDGNVEDAPLEGKKSNTWWIVLLVIGIVLVLLIIVACCCCYKKRKSEQRELEQLAAQEVSRQSELRMRRRNSRGSIIDSQGSVNRMSRSDSMDSKRSSRVSIRSPDSASTKGSTRYY